MTVADFRVMYPEFDSINYPDETVQSWLDFGAILMRASRWLSLRDRGLALFTAHNLSLDRSAIISGQGGNAPPGMAVGVVSGKTVGGVSVNYDTSIGLDPDAGHWNMTVFGRRFWSLVNVVGLGGMQL